MLAKTGLDIGPRNSLHVVPDRSEGELWAVSAIRSVVVLAGNRARGSVRATQRVHADDEESRRVEGSPGTAQQRTPPVGYVRTAGQGMADHHTVVAFGRQLAPGRVRDRYIVKRYARFEGEGRDNGYLLVGNERRKRILRLRARSFLEVFSHWSFLNERQVAGGYQGIATWGMPAGDRLELG